MAKVAAKETAKEPPSRALAFSLAVAIAGAVGYVAASNHATYAVAPSTAGPSAAASDTASKHGEISIADAEADASSSENIDQIGGKVIWTAGGAAGRPGPPGQEDKVLRLFVEASSRCYVYFNASGHPEGVVFDNPEKTEVFTDRPIREASTVPSSAYADDFAKDFAGDPPNMAVTAWTVGDNERAYFVATATGVSWNAEERVLRYAVMQYPGQTDATKGFGGEGARVHVDVEALGFCSAVVDFW